MSLFKKVIDGVYNLLLGLKVTSLRLPERAVTLQYPDERWEMPERSRGIVVLLSDKETGKLNCTACLLCQKACPTAAITIEREKGEDKKWHLTSFTVDNTICCFCGLCEEACNFSALKMATKYEFSVYDQSELVFDMKKLQELGRDVPYTPRPKKKKPVVKKPAPAEPAADEMKPKAEPEKETESKPEPEAETKPEAASGDLFDDAKKEPESNPESGAEPAQKENKPDSSEDKKPEAQE
jgi:NADH-quinone oxidoreductase chain I